MKQQQYLIIYGDNMGYLNSSESQQVTAGPSQGADLHLEGNKTLLLDALFIGGNWP